MVQKLKPHQIYLKMYILVNLKVVTANLTLVFGFGFNQNLLSISARFKLINQTLNWCILCAATPFLILSKNVNNTARVPRLFLSFLWLWFNISCLMQILWCYSSREFSIKSWSSFKIMETYLLSIISQMLVYKKYCFM